MISPALTDPSSAPVITIDGPTASGKGTIASRIAERLGWHTLDSGALYRLVALLVEREVGNPRTDFDENDAGAVALLARGMQADFIGGQVMLGGSVVDDAIRQEHIGALASRLAAFPLVRAELLAWQHRFRRPPGLVADGRDMGTIVFPDAELKVFLTADVESRARRRHKQLMEKGFSGSFTNLLQFLRERDARDTTRAVAPLIPAQGALILDSTHLDVDETVDRVLAEWGRRHGAR